MADLKSKVDTNAVKISKQSSELVKLDDIVSPNDPKEILYPNIKNKFIKILEQIAKSKDDIGGLKRKHNEFKSAVDKIEFDHKAFKDEHEQINSNFSEHIKQTRDSVTENSNANSKLSGRVHNVELDAKSLESAFDDINSKVSRIQKDLGEVDKKLIEVKQHAATAQDMVDQSNAKLKIVEQHLFNKDALTAAILILFFLIIGLMVYVLKLKSSLEPSMTGGSTSRTLKGSKEMQVTLQKMPNKPALDNTVCIVSFDASNSEEYRRIIQETVAQRGGVSFSIHLIRKHADITQLPHCRLYIMCAEFTERHVIIEEQGLGLGDLKLTSYQGIGKLGGALVILYLHDPGSRNIADDKLYSDGVYCVKKQQELRELGENDRFISMHKKLNTAQKKALETAINTVLNN